MKQFRFAVLVTLVLSGGASAQEFQRYTFSDIKWLSAPAVVTSQLEDAGYTIDGAGLDENGTLTFAGSLANERVVGAATFVEQQLLKLDLFVPTAEVPAAERGEAATAISARMREVLSERHGPPTQTEESAAVWLTDEVSSYVGGILLEVDQDEDVAIIYESPRWGLVIDELQGGGIEAF